MSTAVFRDLHRAHPGKFQTAYRGTAPQLLHHNPNITNLSDGVAGIDKIKLEYPSIHQSNQIPIHFLEGYHKFLGEQLGVDIPLTEYKGDVPVSDEEKSWINKVHEVTGSDIPFWIIVAGGKNDYTLKWWSQNRYQEVVDRFTEKILFVQVGERNHHHPALRGVLDLRGQTDMRQFVRLMFHSMGVVCPVTFAMHLSAAVDTRPDRPNRRPCVVVAGGREPVAWEMYPHHQFLHTVGALPCCLEGGCWKARLKPLGDGDPKDESLCETPQGDLPACLNMITPDMVERAINFYLSGGTAWPVTPEQWDKAVPHLTQ